MLNVNNGNHLETYMLRGEWGSGVVYVNGPAALRASVDDVVIVLAYAHMNIEKARRFRSTIIFPDDKTNHLQVTV
jgi:aspartate 1-decarboxylase